MMKVRSITLLFPALLMAPLTDTTAQTSTLDSLWRIWNDYTQPDTIRLDAMDKITWDGYLYSQPDSAFYYAQQAFDLAEMKGLKKQMSIALNTQGVSFRVRGDFPSALEYYKRCLSIREELREKKGIAGSLNNIGLIYYNLDQYPKALEYYKRSLKIYEEIENKTGIAIVLNNIGILYVNHKDKSKALEYFQKSLTVNEDGEDKKGIAGSLNNIGNNYKDQGNFSAALEYHQRSLAISEEIMDKVGIADCLINIGDTYKSQGNDLKAFEYYQRSLLSYEELGDKKGIANSLNGIGSFYGNKSNHQKAIVSCQKGLLLGKEIAAILIQKNACKCLYDAYKALGNGNKALGYHEQMQELNDSLQTEETANQLERMEFQKQMLADSLRQEEEKLRVRLENDEKLNKESRKRNMAMAGGAFFVLLAAGLYHRVRYMRKSRAVIEKERDRSDNLLLNILPPEIAEELKLKGRTTARNFEKVTILFTDFKEFTQASEKLSAQELVEELHTCFEAFDKICEEYGIEKIKTIGDAYMSAGGLPVPNDDSVKNTVLAGLKMAAFMQHRKAEREAANQIPFEMRVGIHTGPVVAGIVGVKKFQYDVWGDTVNTASRIESNGEVGKVNISEQTYNLIKADPQFQFEARGKVRVKGKGDVEMWYVDLA